MILKINQLIPPFLTSEFAEKVECSVLFMNKDWDPAVSSEDFFTPLVPQLESKWTESTKTAASLNLKSDYNQVLLNNTGCHRVVLTRL